MVTNNPPLVSVVLSTYNRASALPKAIDDILNQTMSDLELIIVDDGSEDETQSVLKNERKRDKRIIAVRQSHGGPAAARNRGLKEARGAYIALTDDDDISHPQRLEKQLSFLQDQPMMMACVCYYHRINDERKILSKEHMSAGSLMKESHALSIPCSFILSPMAFIKKEALVAAGGWRPIFTHAEDLDLTLRFQEQFSCGIVQEFLYQYRVPSFTENQQSTNLVSVLKCHISAYISAYYRRYKRYDPLIGYDAITETLMEKWNRSIPHKIRAAILLSASYILGMMKSAFMKGHALTKEEYLQLIRLIALCDANSHLIRRTKRIALYNLLRHRRWRELNSLYSLLRRY